MSSSKIFFSTILSFIMFFGSVQPRISAAVRCPCDIYKDGGTPCVAAHSTVRAMYADYKGPLYQVRRTSDNKTLDIGVLTQGGIANAAAQDSFLNGKVGTISIIYDQSPNHNDLRKSTPGGWLNNGGLEANATAAKIKINGHSVYGVYTTLSWDNNIGSVGYRNDSTKGVATGNQAEGMYMVCSGKHYNQFCCFDYGNAQMTNTDNGNSTMETVYFGSSTQWGHGSDNGPWAMADLENGLEAGVQNGTWYNDGNTPIIADYVTVMVKSKTEDFWALKGGSANTDKIKTMYSGPHLKGWYPKKLEGAIVMGVGGDNSHTGEGTFFEGCMTSGTPSDAIEDSVQANIFAAKYGSNITSASYGASDALKISKFRTCYNYLNGKAIIGYTLQDAQHVNIDIVDQCGRRVTQIINGVVSAGSHTAVWDARSASAGIYVWRIAIDNKNRGTGKIIR